MRGRFLTNKDAERIVLARGMRRRFRYAITARSTGSGVGSTCCAGYKLQASRYGWNRRWFFIYDGFKLFVYADSCSPYTKLP